ncbi:TAFH domain-containing protein [Aphelenchoides bicaudatus]|nr:TAFH domain-containing protein [Aphelenchoides bicaudatus]
MEARVSMFDADYPSPEECLQILGSNEMKGQAFKKHLKGTSKAKKYRTSASSLQLSTEFVQQSVRNAESARICEIYEQSHYQSTCIGNSTFPAFDVGAALKRLVAMLPDCEGVEGDVVAKVSEAAEECLYRLLSDLSLISHHRREPLRTKYQRLNDPRKQLKLALDFEQKAKERRETIKDELPSKSATTKTGKPDKVGLKEIRNANQDEKLFRNANDAALKAVGDISVASLHDSTMNLSGMSIQTIRPQTCRISLDDFLCLLECKNDEELAIMKKYSTYCFTLMSDN